MWMNAKDQLRCCQLDHILRWSTPIFFFRIVFAMCFSQHGCNHFNKGTCLVFANRKDVYLHIERGSEMWSQVQCIFKPGVNWHRCLIVILSPKNHVRPGLNRATVSQGTCLHYLNKNWDQSSCNRNDGLKREQRNQRRRRRHPMVPTPNSQCRYVDDSQTRLWLLEKIN